MKTQQQIEKFIETVENLIPKFEEKKLEYSQQGDELGFNVMKGKIKERMIELNTVRWVIDNSSINEKCVAIEDSACADERQSLQSLQESIEDLDFAILDIITQESFTFSKEDLGL